LQINWHIAAGSNYTATDGTSWGDYATGKWAYGHAQNGVVTTAGATWGITGVQMEVGPVATEFEQEDFGVTLAKCQRYFQILAKHGLGSGGGNAMVGIAAMYNDSYLTCPLRFPVQMRTHGTLTSGSATGIFRFYRNNSNDVFDDFATSSARTNYGIEVSNSTDMSGTAGHAGFIETLNAAAVLTIDAEL
jgi:hypothetical protein